MNRLVGSSCAVMVAATLVAAACSSPTPSAPSAAGGGNDVVGLGAAGSAFAAHLSGAEEVPSNDSPARGQAVFHVSRSGDALEYRLVVANLENVVAAHIHLGAAGTNGPVLVSLFGPADAGGGTSNGVLATGTIEAADLMAVLEGQPLSSLLEAMAVGDTYVNVHTNDGSDPPGTGPGDLPAGEIRGQIR